MATLAYDSLDVRFAAAPDLDRRELVDVHAAHLTDGEMAHARRYHRPVDRNNFVIARGMLRAMLASYVHMNARDIPLCLSAHGRPELDDSIGSPVRFNVSHTRGLVAVVVALTCNVGIDAETVRFDLPVLDIARRHLSADNLAELEQLPPEDQPVRFTEYWVLFEAYAKATGLGLGLSGRDVMFVFGGPDRSEISFIAPADVCPDECRFSLIAPRPATRMAIASFSRQPRLAVRRVRAGGDEPVEMRILARSRSDA